MQAEILDYQEERSLPENYMKVGVKKLLRAGLGDRWQQQRAKRVRPRCPFSWRLLPRSIGQKESGRENGIRSEEKLG